MPRKLAVNPRTNVITLRVTPKMRFGLELLAQERGNTLTEVVVLAIAELFGTEALGLRRCPVGEDQAVPVLDRVWSPHEHERVVRLGLFFPQLMSDRQKHLWLRVQETPAFWRRGAKPRHPKAEDVHWDALAKGWAVLDRDAEDRQ